MDTKDSLLAFDLHSVLFEPNWKEVAQVLWNYNHKLSIVALAFKPYLIYKSLRLLFNDATDEEFFALCEQHCPKLMPLVIDLMNAHRPIKQMVSILKELKAKGYTLHIISNIGPRRYPMLCSRFPELMSQFEQAKIIKGYTKELIKKPNPQFFKDYLHDFNPKNKTVIFIDDNKRNIKAAQSLGFIGICFENPQQLRTQLASMQIL